MLIFFIILFAALAGVAGYLVGVRQRPSPVETRPRAVAKDAQSAERSEADRSAAEKARIIRSLDAEAAQLRRQIADRAAALTQHATFAREREQLFRELADARGDAARYRQLIIDIENNAPPQILSGAAGPDDLKLIVGVGPVLERMLHTLGVTTFRQIARWTGRDVAEFDAKLAEFPGRIVRDQWVTQARELHQSKYGEALDTTRPRG
jgi:predicted flap endonuclease-1-like 5' DNA nuclease